MISFKIKRIAGKCEKRALLLRANPKLVQIEIICSEKKIPSSVSFVKNLLEINLFMRRKNSLETVTPESS